MGTLYIEIYRAVKLIKMEYLVGNEVWSEILKSSSSEGVEMKYQIQGGISLHI